MSKVSKYFIAHNSYLLLFIYCVISGILIRYNEITTLQSLQSGAMELRSGLSEKITGIGQYFTLTKQNEQLMQQNARLLSEVLFQESMLKDSVEIRKLLEFRDKNPVRFITAKVVDRRFDSKENMLIVNAGSNQGVRRDMAVLTPDGLIGRVIMVSSNYSRVMPVIHTDFSVSVVSDSNRTNGILQWQGESERYASLLHVPLSSALGNNENIYTSDFSTFALQAIPVGRIVKLEEGKQFYDITVELAVDFSSLHYVLIAEKTVDQEKLDIMQTTDSQ